MSSCQTQPPSDPAPASPGTDAGLVRGVTLDRWLQYSWEHGVQVDRLEMLHAVRVHTQNSTYDLAIVSPGAGPVLVRGGRYFPEWTRVHFAGCSLGGSVLKRHGVHVGLRMEFHWNNKRVLTSTVHAIGRQPGYVERPTC